MIDLDQIIEQIGMPDVPLVIAVCNRAGELNFSAKGSWPDGRQVHSSDRFYAASLAKQVTGAAAAVLVRQGKIDPDIPIAYYLPQLPEWAHGVTTRHLAHHIAALPAAGKIESATDDWTEEIAFASAMRISHLANPPGTAYRYSNLGYVLIAHIVAHTSGCAFSSFARTQLFIPLDLFDMAFAGPNIEAYSQAAQMGQSRPLTNGDGGLWSTAETFARWLHHQNRDSLGVADLVTAPGKLVGGEVVNYGWGVGLRQHNNCPLFIHGGQWAGCTAKAVRSPSRGIAIAAMSAGASMEALDALIVAVLNAELLAGR